MLLKFKNGNFTNRKSTYSSTSLNTLDFGSAKWWEPTKCYQWCFWQLLTHLKTIYLFFTFFGGGSNQRYATYVFSQNSHGLPAKCTCTHAKYCWQLSSPPTCTCLEIPPPNMPMFQSKLLYGNHHIIHHMHTHLIVYLLLIK